MKSLKPMMMLFGAALMLFTGCVSNKKYAALQQDHEALKAQYQQSQVDLAESRSNAKSLDALLEEARRNNSDQIYSIKSMQGFMIFPDQITTYIADKNMPWEYIWIEFDGLRAKSIVDAAGLSPDNPVYKARSKELREKMMNEMIYIADNGNSSPFHLMGHLYLFIDYFARSAAEIKIRQGSKLRDFYIHEALAFIEQNFQNDITVEDIAEVCGLNRSYFGKIFKEAVGKSPQDFLLNYRMVKAAELLKLTKLSVGDISNAVGYGNQLHFSRAFKNIYGVSPKKWRIEQMLNV